MPNLSNLRTNGFILVHNLSIENNLAGEGIVEERGCIWTHCILGQEAESQMQALTVLFFHLVWVR